MEGLMDLLRGTVNTEQPEVENTDEFRQNIAERRKIAERDALIKGATPLLAGFLFGGGGSAVKVATEGMKQELNRDQQLADLETKSLMGALKAKSSVSGRSGMPIYKPVFNEESGRTTYHLSTPEGLEDTGRLVGYSPKLFKDEEGRQVVATTQAGLGGFKNYSGSKPEAEQGITPYFKKQSDSLTDKFRSDHKTNRDALLQISQGYKLLHMDGVMPKRVALNTIIKMVEKGTLTNEDRNVILGNVGKVAQLKEEIKETTSKEIAARKITEAKALYKEMLHKLVTHVQADATTLSGRGRTPKERDYLLNKLKTTFMGLE